MRELLQNHPGYDRKANPLWIIFFSWIILQHRHNKYPVQQNLSTWLKTLMYVVLIMTTALGLFVFLLIAGLLFFSGPGPGKVNYSAIITTMCLSFVPVAISLILLCIKYRQPKKEQERYYKETNTKPLSLEQREALRLDIVLLYAYKDWAETLEPEPIKELVSNPASYKVLPLKSQKVFANKLYENWGIYNEKGYHEMLQSLWQGMHSYPFVNDMIHIKDGEEYVNQELSKKYAFLLEETPDFVAKAAQSQNFSAPLLVWGFDLRRAIWISRMAYCSGFITKEQAWHDIKITSDYAHALFKSFDEYHQNYLLGFAYWNNEHDQVSERIEFYQEFKKKCKWPIASLPWRTQSQEILPQYMKDGFRNYFNESNEESEESTDETVVDLFQKNMTIH